MNPLDWPRPHQVALVIAAVVGALVGVVVGYFSYCTGFGADGCVSFGYWRSQPFRFGGFWWGVFGAAIGGGIVYARRLLSN